MSFSELGLDPLILKSVLAAGYENATPVQMQAIPAALSGRDLQVSSHTGSGKTAAFLLPSIQRMLAEPTVKSMGPRVLVLTPTRELALQVEKAAMTYGKDMRRFRTACLVGGAPYGLQLKRLSQPVDEVVADPGRLIDHLERGKIDFSRLEVLALDEAARMLDIGFVDDIKAIAARCPAERQSLLFSATLDGEVGNLARELPRRATKGSAVLTCRASRTVKSTATASNIGRSASAKPRPRQRPRRPAATAIVRPARAPAPRSHEATTTGVAPTASVYGAGSRTDCADVRPEREGGICPLFYCLWRIRTAPGRG